MKSAHFSIEEIPFKIIAELESQDYQAGTLFWAVSSGLDSMVLGHLLLKLRRLRPRFELMALHVNYGLRGEESDGDEALIRAFCEQNAVECLVHKPPSKPPKSGIQEWARSVRYAWFGAVATANKPIFVAHHADDVVENIVFRACRGVPLGSLKGFNRDDGWIERPLLGIPKSELENYATRHNVPSRMDSSNDKLIYKRNIIRHEVLPTLTRVHEQALAKLIALADDAEALASWASKTLLAQSDFSGSGIKIEWLRNLPPVVRKLAVTKLIDQTNRRPLMVSQATLGIISDQVTWPEPWVSPVFSDGSCLVGGEGFLRRSYASRYSSGRLAQHDAAIRSQFFEGLLAGELEVCINGVIIKLKNHSSSVLRLRLSPITNRSFMKDLDDQERSIAVLMETWGYGSRDLHLSYGLQVDEDIGTERVSAVYVDGELVCPGVSGRKIILVDWLISIQDQGPLAPLT